MWKRFFPFTDEAFWFLVFWFFFFGPDAAHKDSISGQDTRKLDKCRKNHEMSTSSFNWNWQKVSPEAVRGHEPKSTIAMTMAMAMMMMLMLNADADIGGNASCHLLFAVC